jgi:SAM-dependent methyltransferase
MRLWKSKNTLGTTTYFQNIENSEYPGRESLNLTEVGLPRYSKHILELMNKSLPYFKMSARDNILEFGAGSGYLSELWQNLYSEKVVCVEIDSELCLMIENRGLLVKNRISDYGMRFDLIFSSNVLEHIEDDVSALEEVYDALQPGGVVAIYVPAFQVLYSPMDKEVGHVRRYSKRELSQKILDTGFVGLQIQYCDSLGFFASLLMKTVGYRNRLGIGSLKSLMIYDKYFFTISKQLDQCGLSKILGKNLLAVAMKPRV